MSRPEDIPEDVWNEVDASFAKAWDEHGASFNPASNSISDGLWDRLVEAAARLILAETERCAAVSNSLADEVQMSAEELQGNMRDYRLHRAAGIRHAVSLLRNPVAFSERAATLRKGGA